MSNDPKKPSQRQDLRRWDDEGGAPRSGHPSQESPFAPEHSAETALYYFNIRTEGGFLEDPEGDSYPDLQTAREAAIAKARVMITEGDQKGEDRRSWRVEIMDRANQHLLTVGFSDDLDPKASGEVGAG
ncbi:DUF6894 family protein [Microvirga sp. P5_D2]